MFLRGLRPEIEIRVTQKDIFREVINDTIDTVRRLAANSALRRNRNSAYLRYSGSDQMSNYNNFPKMFHARCKIPNIVRKIFFRYNLLLIPITIGKKNVSH